MKIRFLLYGIAQVLVLVNGVTNGTLLRTYLPRQPVNFQCTSFDFYNMSCSWGSHDNSTFWNLKYRTLNMLSEWKCCPSHLQQNGKCDFFPSPLCDFPGYPDFIQYEDYEMNLTGKNANGLKSWNYTVNTGSQIVKLKPVEIQYVVASKRNELNISWKPCKPYFENTTYLVSWISQWDTFWERKLLNFTEYIVNMSTTIGNLRSNTCYTVNISCRWFSSNQWSKATVVANKTRPTAPDRAPDITNGSFIEVANCVENITSCLYVYWKPLPIWEWNAPNLMYNIKLHDSHNNVVETNVSGNQSWAEFALKGDIRKPFKMLISSYNDNGVSRNMKTIDVHEDIVPPDKVIVETNTSNQGSTYLVTWITRSFQNQTISGATYFWASCCYMCQEKCPPADVKDIHWEDVNTHNDSKWKDDDIHNDTMWNDDDIHNDTMWKDDATQTDSRWINLTNTAKHDWQFGVSIENWKGVKSAISWSDCVFPYAGQYNDVPQMNVQTSATNDTVIEISVSFCNSKMRPFVYQVFFRKTISSEDDIDTKTEVRNFTATPWLQSLILDGLEANTEYSISIAIIGRFFRSNQSNIYQVKTGGMMTPTPTALNLDSTYAIIIGITVSIITVTLSFLLLMYMLRLCKEKCRKPTIHVPCTAWIKVPHMIEVSDGKVISGAVEDDNADQSCMEPRVMTCDTSGQERGLNMGKMCEDGQCGNVVEGSVDVLLFGPSTVNQYEFGSDQTLELSTVRKYGEISRSVTNLHESNFQCRNLIAGERGSSGPISMDDERWRHFNLNKNKEHKVHSYVSTANLISRQLMDVLVDDGAKILVKDEMSECSEIKRDEYEKDDEDSAAQTSRTANENIGMKESVFYDREDVHGMYHSKLNNDTEPYVTVTDICVAERYVKAVDTCGTPSIDSYVHTLPSETSFVISSNVEQENHKNSYIRDDGDEVEDSTNALQE